LLCLKNWNKSLFNSDKKLYYNDIKGLFTLMILLKSPRNILEFNVFSFNCVFYQFALFWPSDVRTNLTRCPFQVCSFVRLSVCSFVCLFICLFVHLSVCSFVCLFICLFVHLFVCLFFKLLFASLFIRLSVYPFVHLSVCLFVRLSVCPFVCLSVCLFVRLLLCLFVCILFVHLSVCSFVRLSVFQVWTFNTFAKG
jgi:hypothetical protein